MRRAVLFCLFLLTAPFATAQPQQQLTLESIFAEGGITGRGPEAIKWSPDGTKVSFLQRDDSGEHGALYYIDVASGKRATLVTEEKLGALAPPIGKVQDEREREWIQRYSVAAYQWAPDSEHLLFNAHGQLWLYSIGTGTAVQLTTSGDPNTDPKLSPDGSRVSYIRKHRLYVSAVKGSRETELAADRDENLWNGEVDWVYAEELAVRSNHFWSPDGKHIAFLQMDEKPVPTYPITDWMPLHPKVDQEKYPKAGDSNPEVRLGVIGSGGGRVRWITPGERQDREYMPRFGWVRSGLVYLELLNRAQNKLELWFADADSGEARKMLVENEPEAWVPVDHAPEMWLLPSQDGFLWPSWRDGYMHLYLYRFDKDNPLKAEAKLERQLTKGEFEVSSIDAVNQGSVYFSANAGDPRQQQIYAAPLDGSRPAMQISQGRGTHQAIFAPKDGYYIDRFNATMTPPRLSLCRADSPLCTPVWESRAVARFDLVEPKALELKAADGATLLYGTLLMPANTSSGKPAPLIVNPYGGPGAQSVTDSWGGTSFLFDQILARKGFAVLHVDNRGMAGRGKAFAAAVRRHLGETELADQLAALSQVLTANSQLDPNRLGCWGWSYGGYMTLFALTHSDKFRAGVAVSPVTDWRNYDSIYTERFMGLPRDNEEGYERSSAVHSAGSLKGRLLEVHGTGDDNVHVQNTMQMINGLIESGVQFDLQLYPRKTHGIAGSAARTHLFQRILEHFQYWVAGR